MASSAPHSIRQWVYHAQEQFNNADLFFGHGTDNALDEAVYLISFALDTNFEFDGLDVDADLATEQIERIHNIIRARIETQQPAAYLTNQAWFAGLAFYVNENVLVPRSPVAELIEEEFQPWIDRKDIHTILEIGTGSGCIAIACAQYIENVHVDAVDIDKKALVVARENVRRHHLQQRVGLYESDLFSAVAEKKYDIIISNPPYVSQAEFESLPAEYTHEPAIGLVAGRDGLDCVRIILKQAVHFLQPHGILIVEVGNSQQALIDACPEVPFTWLEFERGGDGIFLLDAKQVVEFHEQF